MAKSAEFILDYEAKQVLVLEPYSPECEEAIARLAEQPRLQIVECPSLKEIASVGHRVEVCVMIAHCESSEDASGFMELLRTCRDGLKERKIRILITVNKDFYTLQTRFVRAGATEVVQVPVSGNVLYKKLDRYLKLVPSRDQHGNILETKPWTTEPEVSWKDPLDLQSDFWMPIEGKTHWTRASKKWSITLLGPPPSYGEWTESEPFQISPSKPEEQTWEWVPKDQTTDPFVLEEGAWKFHGDKPEFKDGSWEFKGLNPKLAFVQEDGVTEAKLDGNPEGLEITENSPQTLVAAELIEEAWKNDKESQNLSKRYSVNPLLSALLVSEMVQSCKFTPYEMLDRFCEYLKRSTGGAEVGMVIPTQAGWKFISQDKVLNTDLQRQIESGGGTPKLLRSGEFYAYPLVYNGACMAALVSEGGCFSVQEYEGLSKSLMGLLNGMKLDTQAA